MDLKQSKEHICQSCAVSLKDPEIKGTESDGTINDDYCCDCYESGEFIEPELTIKEMIELSIETTSKSRNITLEEAKKYLEFLLPTLKRWQ
jgi:hypothetical protein